MCSCRFWYGNLPLGKFWFLDLYLISTYEPISWAATYFISKTGRSNELLYGQKLKESCHKSSENFSIANILKLRKIWFSDSSSVCKHTSVLLWSLKSAHLKYLLFISCLFGKRQHPEEISPTSSALSSSYCDHGNRGPGKAAFSRSSAVFLREQWRWKKDASKLESSTDLILRRQLGFIHCRRLEKAPKSK